jgi:hypothetical protein
MIRARSPLTAHGWLLAFALAALLPLAAQAQDESALVKRATELREAPGDAGRSLASLPVETALTRLGDRQGPWIRVRTAAGATGWVHLFDVGPASRGAAAPSTGGAAGALRGVTSFFTKPSEQRSATATSTIGIRGLGAEDIAQAQPDAGAVTRMETLRVAEPQARQFARDASLRTAAVEPLPAPPRAGQGGQQP